MGTDTVRGAHSKTALHDHENQDRSFGDRLCHFETPAGDLLEAEAVGVDLAGHELGVLLGSLVNDLGRVGHVHALLTEAERILRVGFRE